MDHLDFDLEIKLADDGASGTIEGYGSVFGLVDRGGDIVEPGAFKASLAEWKRRKQLPSMLWQHDSSSPVGIWTEMVEDDRGLRVKGELILDVPKAAVAHALMKRGAVRGLSIGYRTKESDIDRATGARRLKRVDLYELSLVTIPMLPEAQITGVKGEFDPSAWERAFRDEGLSIREAKLATSVARKLARRDGGRHEPESRDGAAAVLSSLRKATAALSA